jgi:hypothetical protein
MWPTEGLPFSADDAQLGFLVEVLVHGKFYSLFSLRFGIGFAVFLKRAQARGADTVALFRRRLAGLLLIGLAHTTLIWFGDILTPYALLGFALIPFRRWSDGALLSAAVIVFADFIACAEYLVTEGYTTPARLAGLGGSAGGLSHAGGQPVRTHRTGDALPRRCWSRPASTTAASDLAGGQAGRAAAGRDGQRKPVLLRVDWGTGHGTGTTTGDQEAMMADAYAFVLSQMDVGEFR